MIEWDSESQQELLLLAKQDPENSPCLFGNIASFYRPEMRDLIHSLQAKPGMSVEILAPLISEGRAITRTAWCLTHERLCSVKTARRHCAGTSCRPFSKKGMRLGLMDCETVYLLSWIAMRLELQEADILQENVCGSATDIFSRFLGKLYWIDVWKGDPRLLGLPFARERQFVRFRHKVKCMAELEPTSRFIKRFWRAINFEWQQVYCCHLPDFKDKTVVKDELNEELRWAQNRPSSKAHDMPQITIDNHENPFRACLTETEELFWQGYQIRNPGKAGQLNQDSLSAFGHASLDGCLHTLIANCGLIMSDSCVPERWLIGAKKAKVINEVMNKRPSQAQESSSKGSGAEPVNHQEEMPENRGILWGKSKEECQNMKDIDIYAPDVDINLLFGDLHGAALLDKIYQVYGNPLVAEVAKRGLTDVKFMTWSTPDTVWAKFISTHNSFHKGSGNSYMEVGMDALRVEAMWKAACTQSGMSHLDWKLKLSFS
ncbi:Uncharacterized protein SCF082_LOCUS27458 [Durusdinium trenchii]|uniref:Uncharacterized protein n=1 Tax=Durusdinium trenchii TaxID=1381693 RepID=A0ABP0MDX1_9DINO